MLKVRLNVDLILKKHGFTQRQLAEIANVRPAVVNQLANQKVTRLSLHHVEKICNALGITEINEVVTLEETKEG